MVTFLSGGGGRKPTADPPPANQTGVFLANDPLLEYTDCVAPTFVNGYARFQRPISDPGVDYQYCMPGARMRFRTNAPSIAVAMRWNGLVTRTDARNLIGHVYVDGAYSADFQTPAGINTVTTANVNISNTAGVFRLIELILPYADGVEFGGVTVGAGYAVLSAPPRTGRLMVCLGDSLTQGFSATDVRRSWPFQLAQNKGFRCINMGYGGRITVPSDGTAAVNLNPDLITIMLGTNDFLNQIAVATYKANLKALLTNINTVNPNVPVYLTAPIVCTQTRAIPQSSYDPIPGQCIAELAFSQIRAVDRASLITNTATQTDGTHPNDSGSAQMAAGWGAVIT